MFEFVVNFLVQSHQYRYMKIIARAGHHQDIVFGDSNHAFVSHIDFCFIGFENVNQLTVSIHQYLNHESDGPWQIFRGIGPQSH